MTIGEKIRYQRTVHKMSGEQLSELSGISVNTIRKYEAGERKPKPDQLLKISEALGISINTFLDFDIKTVSDLLSLIFKMDEQLDLELDADQDSDGAFDANTIRLSFRNETVNQKLLTYMTAVRKRDAYIASHTEIDNPQYANTLADIEKNISDLQNRLLDDNTIIQKGMTSPDRQTERPAPDAPISSDLNSQLQDILYDCSATELRLITETAQAIKNCLRDTDK